jgi:hypothetical protein
MKQLKTRWEIFKQEYQAIIILSILQIWWCMNYTPFHHLKTPWASYFTGTTCFLGIFLIFFLFVFPDQLMINWNIEPAPELPINPQWLTIISRSSKYVTMAIAFFLMSYFDVYRTPKIYYGVFFCFFLLFDILFQRAVNRNPLINKREVND